MATELLPGHEGLLDDRSEVRRIRRKRRRCALNGHMWHLYSYRQPSTYVLTCVRCHPHIHSRKTVESYNLFSTPQKDSDR